MGPNTNYFPNNIGYPNSNIYGMPSHYGQMNTKHYEGQNINQDGDRVFPFLAPFLLGGVAGAAIAPAFYRPYPVPYGPVPYGPYPYRPYPYRPY